MLSSFKEDFMLKLLSWVFASCLFTIFSHFISIEGEKEKIYERNEFPKKICFELGESQCNLF